MHEIIMNLTSDILHVLMLVYPCLYRNDCAKYLGKRCQAEFKSNPVRDESIWRWKDKLISSITGTLNKLGFYKSGYNWWSFYFDVFFCTLCYWFYFEIDLRWLNWFFLYFPLKYFPLTLYKFRGYLPIRLSVWSLRSR